MTERPPDVDHVRAKLRQLGYLRASVDRFVLAPAGEHLGATAIAARSSLRIGVIGGLLLGPSAAIGIVARWPGLVVGVRDAATLTAYLSLLFGVASAAGAFAITLPIGLLVRRSDRGTALRRHAARVSSAAGILAASGCLAYLALWWRAASAMEHVWGAPTWTMLALLVAVAISLLLGHTVRLTALAVMARHSAAPDPRAVVLTRSWRTTVGLALAALGSAALLLMATAETGGRREPAPADFAVVPTGTRVSVVAIDGLDPALFERLAAGGRLPNLAGVTGWAHARLSLPADRDPARLWTSAATGHPAEAHGVRSLETRRVTGLQGAVSAGASRLGAAVAVATDLLRLTRPAIASGVERRQKTFWEVGAEKGLRTAVVNWWATWPAAETAGIVISDRGVLRLERGGPLDAEIAPADLYGQLRLAWPRLQTDAASTAGRAFGDEVDRAAAILRRSAELDAILIELATHSALGRPDLLSVYLPGLDVVQHELLGRAASNLAASVLDARLRAVERYYAYLDNLLGPLLRTTAPNDLVVLVTGPGRISSTGITLLAMRGDAAREQARLTGSLVDAAPTILYALGFPSSRELGGRALTMMFRREFVERFPPRLVATYGQRAAPTHERGPSALDQEMVERLRSLGYVR